MPTFEFQIAVVDEPESHRKNEGDVVNVTKHPSLGNGRMTIKEYLIVVVDVKAEVDLSELQRHFKQACLADGYNEWDFREINLDPEMGEVDDIGLIHPSSVNLYVIRLSDGVIMPHPKKLGKNRYSIELLALKTNPLMYELDIAKVQDKECVYQPFKTSEDLLLGKPDMFAEIDSGTKPNEFIVVEWSEAEPIVWDNALGKAVSPSDIGLNVVSKEK